MQNENEKTPTKLLFVKIQKIKTSRREEYRGMCVSKVRANVLSRLKRHASDGRDKTGRPGGGVNAVARERREKN